MRQLNLTHTVRMSFNRWSDTLTLKSYPSPPSIPPLVGPPLPSQADERHLSSRQGSTPPGQGVEHALTSSGNRHRIRKK